ncbi:transcription-repair coupling factor [candidate division KSB3 bacterium]|uniref:Transcription-repair-coupling factor n=1 Tax=candidate division KSB3 bacterium TaxID=2044937 RepID=A0A2G6E552_9BACT|nr:MAG: transcription-repair coupling factor [candidate division KSB3 bacterium]PIE29804.1 MAG: transcription-repair coupling factor [candidate division KSB3 bacterium]
MSDFAFLNSLDRNAPFCRIGGLWGSSHAYVSALIAQRLQKNTALCITATAKEAEELYEDLLFFQQLGLLPWKRRQIHLYSPWNIAPYENNSPHREIVAERLSVLDKLRHNERIMVVAPIEAVMHRSLPRSELERYTLHLGFAEELDRDAFVAALVDTGYTHSHLVEGRGEFSVRGGIIDFFPSFSASPIRIELFGDEIESIRKFDPETQRSFEELELINVLPGREIVLSAESSRLAKERIKKRISEVGASLNTINTLMSHIDEQIFFPGVEWYAPYVHGPLDTLLDYLPQDAPIFFNEPFEIHKKCEAFSETVQRHYQSAQEQGSLFPDPDQLFLNGSAFESQLKERQQIHLQYSGASSALGHGKLQHYDVGIKSIEWAYTIVPGDNKVEDRDQRIASTAKRVREWLEDGLSIVISSYTGHQATRLVDILQDYHIPAKISRSETGSPERMNDATPILRPFCLEKDSPRVVVLISALNCGFILSSEKLVFLNEDEFLGKQTVRRRHLQRKATGPQMSLGELELNDYVVHIDNGIGVFLGLKKVTVRGVAMECLHLEYKGGDKLYVPVDRLDLVQKYKGADHRKPSIDKLGGTAWARVRERVKASVEKMAQQLVEIYAARQAMPGVPLSIDEHLYREFEASFEYEETPDQARAIEEVARDMSSSKPMDRLVCGDVGYGKTEVAMRAAFRAVLNGKQVAILVPTTLLAQQHYQNFERRFAAFPVEVGVLSRFNSRKEQQETIKGVKDGTIDIVIGTHRLLQKDIAFHDLGLVVIDEEQRFGVTHKEKIRQYRKLVDVLTLTATPIPRTLHMSLMGVRDLSIIESPPEGRLAVRTYVMRFDDALIHEAITRELDRGGQVYFVHNEVETIEGAALRIRRLLPHINVAVAHGQMKEKELESIMLRFVKKEIDVLISTTIVESGIDIPTVNTMIVNKAHKFGLSQLYQLRGRIGRSNDRAYAYLLIPNEKLLSVDAKKRLRVIQDLSELGSGFKLAAHDLEIRGAGSLLGAEQTGHIAALGFDMYCQVIENTVRELKGEAQDEEFHPQIDLQVSAHFPEEYISDMKLRLEAYKRLMSARDFTDLFDVEAEIEDRYGKLPDEARSIVALAELKLIATRLRIQHIQACEEYIKIVLGERSPIDGDRIRTTVDRFERKVQRLSSGAGLLLDNTRLNGLARLECVKKLLSTLQGQ